MKRTKIITIIISSKSKTNFGVNFMHSIIDGTVSVLNKWKKCYSAKIIKVEEK